MDDFIWHITLSAEQELSQIVNVCAGSKSNFHYEFLLFSVRQTMLFHYQVKVTEKKKLIQKC